MSEALDRVLDNIQALLSVSSFIAVIQELLQDEELRVRRKALEVFTTRVQTMRDGAGITRDEVNCRRQNACCLAIATTSTTPPPPYNTRLHITFTTLLSSDLAGGTLRRDAAGATQRTWRAWP